MLCGKGLLNEEVCSKEKCYLSYRGAEKGWTSQRRTAHNLACKSSNWGYWHDIQNKQTDQVGPPHRSGAPSDKSRTRGVPDERVNEWQRLWWAQEHRPEHLLLEEGFQSEQCNYNTGEEEETDADEVEAPASNFIIIINIKAWYRRILEVLVR